LNESRPTRPPLATIICIYVVVTAFIPLPVMGILLWGWSHSVFSFPWIRLLPHSPMPIVICALALAGTIALWQMRRVAFFLLTIRLILSLGLQAINLQHSVAFFHRMSAILPPSFTVEMRGIYAVEAAQWLLSALIVWYVYRITSPRHTSAELSGAQLNA
jgi:hypothetical protein